MKILREVNGNFKSGHLTAIMGPSVGSDDVIVSYLKISFFIGRRKEYTHGHFSWV